MSNTRLLHMKRNWAIFIFLLLIFIEGCSKLASKVDVNAHREEVEKWKKNRLARLTSDDGWLTLCGLFWLKEGENTIGSDSKNAVILPSGKAPEVVGSIWLKKGTLRFQSRSGVAVKYKDSVITSLTLQSDEEGLADPIVLSIGTLSFFVIKRSNELAVRVKDKENPNRMNFMGLEYFPIDPKWRIEAKFMPYNPPKSIPILNILNKAEMDSCPGALVFVVNGKTYVLDALLERGVENELFVIFSDATNGRETYGMGRYLYTAMPSSDNKVVMDFNKAYNPPCAFTDFATCPIPPIQNHLLIRVEAGEKKYAGVGH